MNSSQPQKITPWYRQRWPWLLMAGPAIVVVAGLFTAWLAVKTNDGLVDDNYYKTGLAVNQQLKEKHLAAELGLKAALSLSEPGDQIHVRLSGLHPDALPSTLQLKLAHAALKGNDQVLTLQRQNGSEFTGVLTQPPGTGRWNVVLEDAFAGWRIDSVWDMQANPRVTISAVSQ